MTSPLAVAIAKSGILDEESLDEFRKWGMPIDEMPIGERPESAEELVLSLEEALQSEGLIVEKITDLEVVRQYLATQVVGSLHIEIGAQSADFEILYGKSVLGEYILQWKGESVAEEMTNGITYLQEGIQRIYFGSVQTLYFGDQKAFMLCTPSTTQMVNHGDDS